MAEDVEPLLSLKVYNDAQIKGTLTIKKAGSSEVRNRLLLERSQNPAASGGFVISKCQAKCCPGTFFFPARKRRKKKSPRR